MKAAKRVFQSERNFFSFFCVVLPKNLHISFPKGSLLGCRSENEVSHGREERLEENGLLLFKSANVL